MTHPTFLCNNINISFAKCGLYTGALTCSSYIYTNTLIIYKLYSSKNIGENHMSVYMYMVPTILFEVTFRTHICSLFSAKVVIAFVCIIMDKQLIVRGCDQYMHIALMQVAVWVSIKSINQFSKDVRIPSSGGRLVLYKYAREVQISKKIV